MRMPDVNVLLYALDAGSRRHAQALAVVDELRDSPEPFGLSHLVLSSVVRLSVNPHAVSRPAASTEPALQFCAELLASSNAQAVAPGARHWQVFEGICRKRVIGYRDIPDAYLAAIAIESGCEFITYDDDFALFAGLRWRLLSTGQSFTNPT